jgi:hypothetical protein
MYKRFLSLGAKVVLALPCLPTLVIEDILFSQLALMILAISVSYLSAAMFLKTRSMLRL